MHTLTPQSIRSDKKLCDLWNKQFQLRLASVEDGQNRKEEIEAVWIEIRKIFLDKLKEGK